MNPSVLKREIGRLDLLKHAPPNPLAIAHLAEMLSELCPDEATLTKVIDAALSELDEWCGPRSFRQFVKSALPRKASSDGVDPACEWIPPWKAERDAA